MKVKKKTQSIDVDSKSVALRVQEMPFTDQGLVLGRIAQLRSDDKSFSVRDLEGGFFSNSLPPPRNIPDTIRKLRNAGLITMTQSRKWVLTPRGRHRSVSLLSDLDLATFAAEAAMPTASFGHLMHTVVPPELAPPKLMPALTKFLAGHPFQTNVFGMTRFPEKNSDARDIDPVTPALEIAREVCRKHGLSFHLASDRAIDDDLWTNVAAQMWASQYGIAFFEDRRKKGMNYNLTIEVGGMLITGRRCALLKDSSVTRLPTDLVGQIYQSIDLDVAQTVASALHKWVRDDLNLGACSDCG